MKAGRKYGSEGILLASGGSGSETEFLVGQFAQVTRSFGKNDLRLFADMTGDWNPIHLDEGFARATRFKRTIVHGMLCASLISAVLGTKLPGPGAIYLSQTLKFVSAVGVGETITAEARVTSWRPDKRILILQTRCFTSTGQNVIEGEAVVLVETKREIRNSS